MEMLGIGGRPQFESHIERLKGPAKTIMVNLRQFVLSLGSNVIEDVRPHRVVYSKTLNFRMFLDVEPAGDSLVLSIKSGRGVPAVTATIRTAEDAESIKKQIAEAYNKIQ
jgi:hypothetical protein